MSPNVRIVAAEVLGEIGPATVEALPSLEGAAVSNDPDLREKAEEAMRKIRSQ